MKTWLILLFTTLSSFTLKAQFSAQQIKSDLAGKEWKIVKYETFGVEEEPKPEQLNDKFFLSNKEQTFVIVENGKEYKGTWVVMANAYLSCKSSSGEWHRTYKVITITEKTATIEYKDPDLTRTLYRLELK